MALNGRLKVSMALGAQLMEDAADRDALVVVGIAPPLGRDQNAVGGFPPLRQGGIVIVDIPQEEAGSCGTVGREVIDHG